MRLKLSDVIEMGFFKIFFNQDYATPVEYLFCIHKILFSWRYVYSMFLGES